MLFVADMLRGWAADSLWDSCSQAGAGSLELTGGA